MAVPTTFTEPVVRVVLDEQASATADRSFLWVILIVGEVVTPGDYINHLIHTDDGSVPNLVVTHTKWETLLIEDYFMAAS
jgi:hypothetical protein